MDEDASQHTNRLVLARALRGFADGLVSVIMPGYLLGLGYSPSEVGAVVASCLLGSAAFTLVSGFLGHRVGARSVLYVACGLMALTGFGFATVTAYAALLLLAFVGTMNPSGSDVSLFLPVEQS